jgi:hypothetical protein
MFHRSGYFMMYRPTDHRRGYINCLRLATFPVQDANFVQIENQFSQTGLDVFIQIMDCSLEERSGCLQTLLFFGTLFVLVILSR